MSDTTEGKKNKGGRPRTQPDDLPIIIAEARSRVQELVTMPAFHAKLLRQYSKWASKKAAGLGVVLTEEEAMSLVLSQGIDLIVQRDKAWAKDKRASGGEEETSPAAPEGGPAGQEGAGAAKAGGTPASTKPPGAADPSSRTPVPPATPGAGRNGVGPSPSPPREA